MTCLVLVGEEGMSVDYQHIYTALLKIRTTNRIFIVSEAGSFNSISIGIIVSKGANG